MPAPVVRNPLYCVARSARAVRRRLQKRRLPPGRQIPLGLGEAPQGTRRGAREAASKVGCEERRDLLPRVQTLFIFLLFVMYFLQVFLVVRRLSVFQSV